jgi:hypothetical protein
MMALLHMAGLENSECILKIQSATNVNFFFGSIGAQLTINVFWTESGCIRFNDWKVDVRWIFMSNSSEGGPVGIFKCGSRK